MKALSARLFLDTKNSKSYASFLLNQTHNHRLDQAFNSIEATYRGMDVRERDAFTAAIWPVVNGTQQAPHVASRVQCLAYAKDRAATTARAAQQVVRLVCDASASQRDHDSMLTTACFEMASMADRQAMAQMQAVIGMVAHGHGKARIVQDADFALFLHHCAQIARPNGNLLKSNFFGVPEAYRKEFIVRALARVRHEMAKDTAVSSFAAQVETALRTFGPPARCLSISRKAWLGLAPGADLPKTVICLQGPAAGLPAPARAAICIPRGGAQRRA